MYSNQKKWIPIFFAIKSSFKVLALATPNEVDHVMKDWRRITSGTSQSFICLFCLLDDRIALPSSVCLFFVEENSSPLLKQQFPKLEGFRDSWRDVTTHSETQTLFYTDTRSSSLGLAEAGTLKLDHRALKCQIPSRSVPSRFVLW